MRHRALNLIWGVMCDKKRGFTIAEVAKESGCDKSTVGKYLKKLCAAGFVKLAGARKNGNSSCDRYRITRVDAPDLELLATAEEGAQEKIWRSMRIFKTFTVGDIAMVCGLHEDTVGRYVNKLKQVDYVRVHVSNKGGGKAGAYHTYRLVRDTGPRSPVVLGDGRAFDCNLNQFFGGKDGRNHNDDND
ncbi:hypothetical protein [Pseudanabaena sp. PCC 6802]|uniref:hypothetical protein n=1 Tax=Pseudanabaena sp. PCC 6802 TaxID=118173 RepID=UPI00034BAA91|nr:hypothetical protein [Pseudanabaena sp. PCC 6802]